jgi:hypothetical protein
VASTQPNVNSVKLPVISETYDILRSPSKDREALSNAIRYAHARDRTQMSIGRFSLASAVKQ